MRFLLIDDHALFRFGLRALLMSLPGGHEVTEVASCEAALALDAAAVAPDVVVLDLTLPGIQGLEGLERLRAWHPPAAIVVMSAA
jgi:two-component system nitrate/nitrite response regulator NarL